METGWVSSMVKHFNGNTGMVAGFSLPSFDFLFSAVQALDHLFLISVASGFAGLGIPQSCIGNNIAFRRSAYDEIGGYDGIGRTVTEDVGLLKNIADRTSYKVIFNRDRDSLIRTRAASDIGELKRQRMRWLIGGHESGAVMLISLVLTFLAVLFSAATILMWPIIGISAYSILSIAIFFGSNLSIMMKNRHFASTAKIIRWFLPYQIFFIIYSLYFGFLFITGKRTVEWKGRKYN